MGEARGSFSNGPRGCIEDRLYNLDIRSRGWRQGIKLGDMVSISGMWFGALEMGPTQQGPAKGVYSNLRMTGTAI